MSDPAGGRFEVEGTFLLHDGRVGVWGSVLEGSVSHDDRLRAPSGAWSIEQLENLRELRSTVDARESTVRIVLTDARREDLPPGTVLWTD